ncbi:MAG: PASTA domain-containing protein [Clostridia bacterium]|nr:PASTA domain-containing protein [Clostridia bacterium]
MMSMTGQGLCIEQSPAAGEYVQPGTTIFLLMAGDDE